MLLQAKKMMGNGYTLLDARITSQHEESHPAEARSAPIYRLVPDEKKDFWNMSKKITSAFLMQDPTGEHWNFWCPAV